MTPDLVLLAAAHLHVGGRRLRALAAGDDAPLRDWVGGDSARRLAQARSEAARSLARLAAFGGRVVSLGADEYPPGLRDLGDPPAFLCVRGSLPPSGIAIVGSRTPPSSALTFAYELARAIAEPVIAGLAAGIDAAAHRGALAAGTPTVAYVGHGLGATYPPEHRTLETTIAQAGGAVASERLPYEAVAPWALVKRDRLQAAHARAVVLVASEADGGAMHTVASARRLRRPVFVAAPQREGGARAWSGNARALAEGATTLPLDVAAAIAVIAATTNGSD